jgi:thymidylate synthase
VGKFAHTVVDAHVYCGEGERGAWYEGNLPELRERVRAVDSRAGFADVREWLVESAPEEPGEEGYDHVPGLLEQCTREPKPRPSIEVADKPLDELAFEDIELHDYEHAPSLRFAVAE